MAKVGEVKYNNLIVRKEDTKSITLALSATEYKAGMIVTSQTTGKFEHAIIINPEDTTTGTQSEFSEQEVYVLIEDMDATLSDKVVVGVIGEFNRAEVKFAAGQTEAEVAGTLQAKNIKLTDWSKL